MNNWGVIAIKDAKFSGFSFDINLNIQGDFQICISVPLMNIVLTKRSIY